MDRAGKSRQEDVDLVQGACGQTQRVVHEMCQVTLACGSASCVKLAIIFLLRAAALLRAIFGGNLRGMGAKIHHSTFAPPENSNTTTTSHPPPLLPQLHLSSFLSRSFQHHRTAHALASFRCGTDSWLARHPLDPILRFVSPSLLCAARRSLLRPSCHCECTTHLLNVQALSTGGPPSDVLECRCWGCIWASYSSRLHRLRWQ